MVTSDPNEIYKVQQSVLEWTGSWPKLKSTTFYKLRWIINLLWYNTFIALNLTKFIYDYEGLESITYVLFMNLEGVSYIPKLIIFYYKKDQLLTIIKNINNPILRVYDEDLDIYIKRKIATFKIVALGFKYLCVLAIMTVGLLPFFGKDFDWDPPFPIPVNLKNKPLYVYVFFWIFQVSNSIVGAVTNMGMDVLICSVMGLSSAHLEILREQIKRVANLPNEHFLTEIEYLEKYGKNDDKVLARIAKCVIYHDAIERLVLSIDDMFNATLLIQFISSALVICLNCFIFILYPIVTIRFLASFLFFGCVLTELAIYCVFGNDVIVQSSKITDACYHSDWWNCGIEVRRSLLIIMERAKRPYQFTAGKFIILSLSSLLTICKSAFSYTTVLNQMYTKSATGELESKF